MEEYIPKLSDSARRWLRFAGLLIGIGLLCWIAYSLRSVFTPILVALALAYVLNPVVTCIERTQKISRLSIVVVAFALLAAVILSAGLFLGSMTVSQVQQLTQKLPGYYRTTQGWLATQELFGGAAQPAATAEPTDPNQQTSPATTVVEEEPAAETPEHEAALPADWWKDVTPLVAKHGSAVARSIVEYLFGFLSSVVNLITLLVLIPMYTFFFLWRFNDIVRVTHNHIPAAYRERIVHVARTTDGAIANFFRGRLIVCLIVGTLTGIGWSIVGVPYSLLLGLMAGVFNIVPFLSLAAVPPALFAAYLGATEAGEPWVLPVVLAMAVYMVVQALESFLLSPYIEGQSSGLHPLVIVIALMIGAQLAGLLGMLLAIPVASTLKALAAELVLPEVRRLAGHPDAKPPESSPEARPDANEGTGR